VVRDVKRIDTVYNVQSGDITLADPYLEQWFRV
jgi:hypothetical protein